MNNRSRNPRILFTYPTIYTVVFLMMLIAAASSGAQSSNTISFPCISQSSETYTANATATVSIFQDQYSSAPSAIASDSSSGTTIYGPIMGGKKIYVYVKTTSTYYDGYFSMALSFSQYSATLNGATSSASSSPMVPSGYLAATQASFVAPATGGDFPLDITGLVGSARFSSSCSVTIPLSGVIRVTAAPAPTKAMTVSKAKKITRWVARVKLRLRRPLIRNCSRDDATMVTCIVYWKSRGIWRQRAVSAYYNQTGGPYYTVGRASTYRG